MSYQIQYESEKNKQYPMERKSALPKRYLVGAIIVALVVSVISVPSVRELLIPGDPEVTGAAFSQMIDNLQEGDSVGEAVTAFCREIIQNGD